MHGYSFYYSKRQLCIYTGSLANLRRAGYMQCCLTRSGSRVPLSSVSSLSLLLLSRSDRLTSRRLGPDTDGAGEKNAEIGFD